MEVKAGKTQARSHITTASKKEERINVSLIAFYTFQDTQPRGSSHRQWV